MSFLGNSVNKIFNIIYKLQNKKIYKYEQNSRKCSVSLMPKDKFNELKNFWKKYDKHYKGYEHVRYYTVKGEVNKLYIPNSYYYSKVDYFYNNWPILKKLDNKCLYEVLFPNVKHPESLAKRINNNWYVNNKLCSLEQVKEVLNNVDEFVVKVATESSAGNGVRFFKEPNKEFEDFINIEKDLIIQKTLKQSPTMSKLNKSSINTIRVLTFCTKEGYKCLSTVVRFGLAGQRKDNAGNGGGLVVGVEDNGQLKKYLYNIKKYERYEVNPNGGDHTEIIIPHYDDIKKKAIELHSKFNHSRLISWDFALDESDEIVLIEANLYYGGIEIHQYCNGPVFKTEEELLSILNEVNEAK